MFCSKCGRKQAENALFCSTCGAPLPRPDTSVPAPEGMPQASENAAPSVIPPARPAPSVPPARAVPPAAPVQPKKSNSTFFIVLGVAVVVLIGIAVTLFIILPQSRQASATLSSAGPASTPPAQTAVPARGNTAAVLRVYASPVFETGTSISSVLSGKTWVLTGIAHNPGQTYGEEGKTSLSDLAGYTARLEFTADTLTVYENTAAGGISQEKLEYTISGHNHCNTKGQNKYMRFYLGTDGNLYRTYMAGDEPCSDYTVFSPSS